MFAIALIYESSAPTAHKALSEAQEFVSQVGNGDIGYIGQPIETPDALTYTNVVIRYEEGNN